MQLIKDDQKAAFKWGMVGGLVAQAGILLTWGMITLVQTLWYDHLAIRAVIQWIAAVSANH